MELRARDLTADEQRRVAGALPGLADLLAETAARGISHCVWKSNQHLGAALAGQTDLDLLVDRAHAPALGEVLARHAVKRLVPARGAAYPGTEHYLGMDPASCRLYHLHVHYQLVLGERYVKCYRIPIEQELLRSVRLLDGVLVPRAELELAILALRALLKYRARDVAKDVLHIRTPGVPSETRAEIDWLLAQTTVADVRAVVSSEVALLPVEAICDFLETITAQPRAGLRLAQLRSRARRALRGCDRYSRPGATVRYLAGLWRARRPRFGRRGAKMTAATGGATIAVVGADGAGKSTAAEALAQLLSWKLDTTVSYMGSKAPSRRSRVLYVVFRALRRSHRRVNGSDGAGAAIAPAVGAARDATLALHHLSIGRDRARRCRRGRRAANAGRVVVFDRFPLETLSGDLEHRLLDGPQIESVLHGCGWFARASAALETRMYRRFGLPDQLVVLQVAPEIAVARKPDHEREAIARKGRAAVELADVATATTNVRVVRVDANDSRDEVLATIAAQVWHAL
jgi:hypothetical protein